MLVEMTLMMITKRKVPIDVLISYHDAFVCASNLDMLHFKCD